MPELPEVEHIRRYVSERLLGRALGRVTHLAPAKVVRGVEGAAALTRAIEGTRVICVSRAAKLLLLDLSSGRTLAIHPKLTGKVWVEGVRDAAGCEEAPPRDGTERLVIEVEGARALRYEDARKLGWVALWGEAERDRALRGFGPDAWRASEEEIALALGKRRGRVKPALLDQRVVAGVGNIYADEILHRARLHPLARIDRLPLDRVLVLGREVRAEIARAVVARDSQPVPDQERVGSGARGVARKLEPRVYQRAGEPCTTCRTPIERIVVGGRGTYLCPGCQPPDASRRTRLHRVR